MSAPAALSCSTELKLPTKAMLSCFANWTSLEQLDGNAHTLCLHRHSKPCYNTGGASISMQLKLNSLRMLYN